MNAHARKSPLPAQHLLGWRGRNPIFITAKDLNANIIVCGESGTGKSDAVLGIANFLIHAEPGRPFMVLDGVGTLAPNIALGIDAEIEALTAAGRGAEAEALARRLIYIKVEPSNETGISINMTQRRMKVDTLGRRRIETVHERSEVPMGTLAHTTEGSEAFLLVQTYGRAALTALIAGGAKHSPRELTQLLSPGNLTYLDELRTDIEHCFRAEHGVELSLLDPRPLPETHPGAYIHSQWQVLMQLFGNTQQSRVLFQKEVGSTLRHFSFLTGACGTLFSSRGIDYGAFHDAGGILLVESADANPHVAALVRRTLYAVRHAHIEAATTDQPSTIIIDEPEGMKASLYTQFVAKARNQMNYHMFLFQAPEQIGEAGAYFDELAQLCQWKIFYGAGKERFARELLSRDRSITPGRLYLKDVTNTLGGHEDEGESESEGEQDSWSGNETIDSAPGVETRHSSRRNLAPGESPVHSTENIDVYRSPGSHAGSGWGSGTSRSQGRSRSRGKSWSKTLRRDRISVSEQKEALLSAIIDLPVGAALHFRKGSAPAMIRHRYIPEPMKALPQSEVRQRMRRIIERQIRYHGRGPTPPPVPAVPPTRLHAVPSPPPAISAPAPAGPRPSWQ